MLESNTVITIIRRTANVICLLASSILIHPVFALEFECSSGTDNRFIRQELPGLEHLCEVTVTDANNERKVMWYANHDTVFCSEKIVELKTKYEREWGFQCKQWPDHDGVDQLSTRQRTILDTELKFLIESGQNQSTPFVVEGLKAAASNRIEAQDTGIANTLVVQFFLHTPQTGEVQDVTHIIQDDGVSWNTLSKIDTLAQYIDTEEGYTVDSALISTVSDNGAMEIITVIDATDTDDTVSKQKDCYGSQTLAAEGDSELVARTPHRFICTDNRSRSDAG